MGPNPKNGLGDTRCSGKRGFNDGLARSGGWWAGTPRVVTMGVSSGTLAPPPVPHWLNTVGLTIFPRKSLGFITLPLPGFSYASILRALTSADCHSRLVVLESGPF